MKLLEVIDIKKYFPARNGLWRTTSGLVRAVDGISLNVASGGAIGIVGQTGCGKTTLARCILRLVEPTSGSVRFDGIDLLALDRTAMQGIRRRMQMIFQDPFASLNPRMQVGQIIEEPLLIHRKGNQKERKEKVEWLLENVGMDPSIMRRYPGEFSGGQRQRIGIARALALNPELIVADEPVSSLDVSVQAQILNLICDLKEKMKLAILWIAHDLSIIHHVSDQIAVMYLGKFVEIGSPDRIFHQPYHPYTQVLISSIPDRISEKKHEALRGEEPSALDPPSGCRYRTRCPIAEERCSIEEPLLRRITPGEEVACHLVRV